MYIEVEENFPIKNLTSFKIGGVAEKLYFPKTQNEFIYLLKTLNSPIVFGNWSNVLISSEGIKGNVICTSKLDKIEIEGSIVKVDCGVKGPLLSQKASEQGLAGFEFMIGFPGSVGGNVYMNASAHNQAISDFLTKIIVFDMIKKEVIEIDAKILTFEYRHSVLQKKPYILLSAEFKLEEQEVKLVQKKMKKNLEMRKNHQPNLKTPNAGSVFRNPELNSAGRLLEEAGCKKFEVGGAKIWDKHANFIINSGDATSTDVLELMLKMYEAVKEKHEIRLQPEVKFFGETNAREKYICNTLFSQK